MKDVLQLKVSLDESNPLIWRRILIHKDASFFELHHTIQIAIGWQNYHMFEFILEGYRIGHIFEDEELDGLGGDSLLDSRNIRLKEVISSNGVEVKYVYDFGDYWEHTIVVEEMLDLDPGCTYPVCIAGEMACPPEDCGGIHAHYENLEILSDKKHPEYKGTKSWMPRGYDPAKFNLEKVNQQLNKLDVYIRKWLRS
jgi:hypothetical protein